ncbi:MAG: hypothetical protein CFE27_08765 [Alphaproteobacteria bacterium PA1]|nr:MAG: hypothetical protein CFE27_08765 [Alphaproteobacteria bacterium PA1]
MQVLKEANAFFGVVQYSKPVEAIPATSSVVGNTTNITPAQAGIPAYFECKYFIKAVFEEQGVSTSHLFSLDTKIFDQPADASYRHLEDTGAQRLSVMLREIADALDAQMAKIADEQDR